MKVTRPSRPLTVIVTVLTAVSLVFGMGCYGSFPLTRAVHRVNDTPGNDLVDSVVMWVFIIVPVYEVAMLSDVVVLNLLEFWVEGDVYLAEGDGADQDGYDLQRDGPDRLRLVKVTEGDERVLATFVRLSDKLCEVRGADGDPVGRAVREEGGRVVLKGADGSALRVLQEEQIQACLRKK